MMGDKTIPKTLEQVEEELAHLAMCATRSEEFDEDRAQYLLDLQAYMVENDGKLPPGTREEVLT